MLEQDQPEASYPQQEEGFTIWEPLGLLELLGPEDGQRAWPDPGHPGPEGPAEAVVWPMLLSPLGIYHDG